MRKINFLPLVLVVSVMLIGIGYAAWNQDLQINGTISTGNFDVVWEAPDNPACPSDPFVNASIEQDPSNPHALIFSVENLYPGAEFNLYPKAKNIGTIPARVGEVAITAVDDPDNIMQYMEYHGAFTWSQDGSAVVAKKDIAGSDWRSLSGLGQDLGDNMDFSSIQLDPNGWFEFDKEKYIHIRMSENAPNISTEGKSLKLKLTFDWVQAGP